MYIHAYTYIYIYTSDQVRCTDRRGHPPRNMKTQVIYIYIYTYIYVCIGSADANFGLRETFHHWHPPILFSIESRILLFLFSGTRQDRRPPACRPTLRERLSFHRWHPPNVFTFFGVNNTQSSIHTAQTTLPPTLPPTRVWEVLRTVAAPPIVVK